MSVETDSLSTTFAALADPTRRAILTRLTQGSATVKELSAPFAMSGPAISKHLRVLERAGLISQGREAQWRPCQLEAAPLKAVADWTESYRRFWEGSFDRLEEYLADLQSRPSHSDEDCSPPAKKRRRVTRAVSEAKPAKSKRTQNERRASKRRRPSK